MLPRGHFCTPLLPLVGLRCLHYCESAGIHRIPHMFLSLGSKNLGRGLFEKPLYNMKKTSKKHDSKIWMGACQTQTTQLNQANSKKKKNTPTKPSQLKTKPPQLTVTNPATSIDANHFFKASGSSSAEASNKRPCSKSSPRFEVFRWHQPGGAPEWDKFTPSLFG